MNRELKLYSHANCTPPNVEKRVFALKAKDVLLLKSHWIQLIHWPVYIWKEKKVSREWIWRPFDISKTKIHSYECDKMQTQPSKSFVAIAWISIYFFSRLKCFENIKFGVRTFRQPCKIYNMHLNIFWFFLSLLSNATAIYVFCFGFCCLDHANCHEFVILAAFWVNIFQEDSSSSNNKNNINRKGITYGNVRNLHQSLKFARWWMHFECGICYTYIEISIAYVFCTPRHWLIYDTVTI